MDVVVADVTAAGKETARAVLKGVSSTITLGEVIRLRVRDEVARHNASPEVVFNTLVQQATAGQRRPGSKAAQRMLDWEQQADIAIAAFERNSYCVFVAGKQISDLETELTLTEADVVSFFRLVPLVG